MCQEVFLGSFVVFLGQPFYIPVGNFEAAGRFKKGICFLCQALGLRAVGANGRINLLDDLSIVC